MGESRDRMEQDLQIRGFSPSTQQAYLARMKAMVRFFMRPPDELTLEDLALWPVSFRLLAGVVASSVALSIRP